MASFYFKKFAVRQSGSAMKVNTDGVLLPAWVSISSYHLLGDSAILKLSKEESIRSKHLNVLDIGSGTGVISLIIAQRLSEGLFQDNFGITAIDIDFDSYLETQHNFEKSIWKERLDALHFSLQDYSVCWEANRTSKFDLILSNPPFFTNSLNAPSIRRNIARHNNSLPLVDLLNNSALLLKEGGVLAVILPVQEGETLLKLALNSNKFEVKRLCKVKTLLSKPFKRYMIELRKVQPFVNTRVIKEEILVMQEEGGFFYTNEYNELVKSFYLKDLKVKKHSK